jgi:hypothetical protein
MKAKTFLLHLSLFVPFLASQAGVGLIAGAEKEKAPKFVVTTFNNKKISLSDFKGKPILLKSSPHGDLSADRRLLS